MCPERLAAPNLAAWLTRGSSQEAAPLDGESLVVAPQLKSAPLPKIKGRREGGEHQRQTEMCS